LIRLRGFGRSVFRVTTAVTSWWVLQV
jgi:hypothetical protein